MARIGLALSGGGFRASLYHIGVIRYLRDAGILPRITHITSVSGGSVFGAHLVLNWDRYCGSDSEFQEASQELLKFFQMDVRNRILRRFPLASAANILRRLTRNRPMRQYTRAGLLEQHYEKHLYGDIGLFQLPDHPRLHMLATNLSEGCLCSFYQGGLLLQQRVPGRLDSFEHVEVGLATVPMAVAASSAFPGFFPPLELHGKDVGASAGEFNRQSFTDGGIYDNLGLRMFRCMEQAWSKDVPPLTRYDLIDADSIAAALQSAATLPEDSPLRRLSELVNNVQLSIGAGTLRTPAESDTELLVRKLSEVMQSGCLYRDALFDSVELPDSQAESLLQFIRQTEREPEISDRTWLNRQIIEASLRQVVGKPCIRPREDGFEQIFVSNAGAKFKVTSDGRATGLIRTGMRATDILMDRVNQLELESFQTSKGVVFFQIDDVVSHDDDPHAPHPEIQRRAALIRTDMDRFTDLEISSLIQHGFCVARRTLINQNLIDDPKTQTTKPWNPLAKATALGVEPANDLATVDGALETARILQRSASRKIWGTIFSFKDWPTYVWIPILLVVTLAVPITLYQSNKHSKRQSTVLTAVSATSPLYRRILNSLENDPVTDLPESDFEVVESLEPMDLTGFEVLSDDRIFDLRAWSKHSNSETFGIHMISRVRIRRTEESGDSPHFRIQSTTQDETLQLACTTPGLNPIFRRQDVGNGLYVWELDLDLSDVPIGGDTVATLEAFVPTNLAGSGDKTGRFQFTVYAQTSVIRIWMLMPESERFDNIQLGGHPLDKPGEARVVLPTSAAELPVGSIATFQLINPDPGYRYYCQWQWQSELLDP